MSDPAGFRRERGLLWPDGDKHCARVIFKQTGSIDDVLKHVTNFDTCVQAGGNCGIWPRELAKRFSSVFTAEPHPQNFIALRENTKHLPNVHCIEGAFGQEVGFVEIELDPKEKGNMSAFYVRPGGEIPVFRIDDVLDINNVGGVGLIYLDVEGFEEQALRGAEASIRKSRPVIAVENRGHAKRYGLSDQSCEEFILSLGYRQAGKTGRDVIYSPA